MPLFAVKGSIVSPMTGLALCQPDLFLRFWENVRCLGTVRTRLWWHGCVVVASLNVCVMPRITVRRGFLPYCLMSYGIFTKALRTFWSMTLMRRSSAQNPPRGQQLLEAPNHLGTAPSTPAWVVLLPYFRILQHLSVKGHWLEDFIVSLCRLEIDCLWA